MAKIGYARVSTLKQDLGEQILELEKFGCKKIFSGKHSGKAEKNEEQLNELLNYIREGDTVVVTKLDRLGRSLSQCLKVLDFLLENKIGFIALNQSIDTTKRKDPMAMAMIHLLGLFAELERNFIVERTQGGKLTKVLSGNLNAFGGRPRKLSESSEKRLVKELLDGVSINYASTKYAVSRATISRYKKRYLTIGENNMIGKSDSSYINLAEDYEINYILRKYGWSQTSNNREILRKWANEAKARLGRSSKQNITHEEFYVFIEKVKGNRPK